MIERLQRKFVLIAMGSLLLILLIMLGTINLLNLYHMNGRLDRVLYMIAENDGQLPEYETPHETGGLLSSLEFQMTPETRFETRYFTVRLNQNGSVIAVDINQIAAVKEEQAVAYARQIIALDSDTGYLEHYKYQIIEAGDTTLLIVLDCRMQLQSVESFFQISCLVGLASLLLMFLLASGLSSWTLPPVQASLDKQKQFITDAGHEIKTPLAVIAANTDVLEISMGKNEWTGSIHRQTKHLDALVKQMLTLSRLEEEQRQRPHSPFYLSDLLWEVVGGFQAAAALLQKQLCCEIPPKVTVCGDREEIGQVVTILLDNALKYSGKNSVIALRLYRKARHMVVDIENTLDTPLRVGNPMQLFDRFYREDSSRSRESGGYGIGLSIAKAIVEAHGGNLSAILQTQKRIVFQLQLLSPPTKTLAKT